MTLYFVANINIYSEVKPHISLQADSVMELACKITECQYYHGIRKLEVIAYDSDDFTGHNKFFLDDVNPKEAFASLCEAICELVKRTEEPLMIQY